MIIYEVRPWGFLEDDDGLNNTIFCGTLAEAEEKAQERLAELNDEALFGGVTVRRCKMGGNSKRHILAVLNRRRCYIKQDTIFELKSDY